MLAAGNVTSITTPDALIIDGSTVSGNRIEVDAGSLSIESRQDTSTLTSDDDSWGVQAGYSLGSGGFNVSGNMSSGEQDGAFASVEQLVATISRDTGSANAGALIQEST